DGFGSWSAASWLPVEFSLRRKQSVIRSPRLYSLPERRLYSGNIPATSTRGIDLSRWPAFMWQFVHDMPPGAKRGASAGVFVNSLNPRRISSDSFELSSVLSASGLRGNSQPAFMLIEAAMSEPAILIGEGGGGSAAGRLHAVKASSASAGRR